MNGIILLCILSSFIITCNCKHIQKNIDINCNNLNFTITNINTDDDKRYLLINCNNGKIELAYINNCTNNNYKNISYDNNIYICFDQKYNVTIRATKKEEEKEKDDKKEIIKKNDDILSLIIVISFVFIAYIIFIGCHGCGDPRF